MMKHYGYSAKEATAWCRVCRPGCVVGPQQQYLETIQERMWQEGRRYRHERQSTGQAVNPNNTRGVPTKSTRLDTEVIGSSHEHVDSSLTSRILKKQEQLARSSPSTGRGVSTGGGLLSRTTNGPITERERTPSISRPNTSSGIDSTTHDRDIRRDSRGSRKGSGNIDWSLQQDSKQLTITTSSRPKTSYTENDVTKVQARTQKNSFVSTTSTSNGSTRSTGSNSSGTTTGQSQSEEKISLSRMLWSSGAKTKLKSSSVSPTPATSQSQSLQSRESNPRKNSFGKSNVTNSSLGMKKLSIK